MNTKIKANNTGPRNYFLSSKDLFKIPNAMCPHEMGGLTVQVILLAFGFTSFFFSWELCKENRKIRDVPYTYTYFILQGMTYIFKIVYYLVLKKLQP